MLISWPKCGAEGKKGLGLESHCQSHETESPVFLYQLSGLLKASHILSPDSAPSRRSYLHVPCNSK
jgi:hypothetical protein